MSIVVSVKVYDGVVLGADSQAQIYGSDQQGRVGVVKEYSNARKLFQIGTSVGVVTYGIGNIGKRSIESLVFEFNEQISARHQSSSVEQVSRELLSFLRERYAIEFGSKSLEQQPVLGVMSAGYTQDVATPEEWEFLIPHATEPQRVRPVDAFGAAWRGVALPFARLYSGLDPRVIEKLQQLGVSQDIVAQIMPGFAMPIIFDNMPLQDALDFAEFVLFVTINVSKFELGPAACGGPIELAVIRRDVGFRWIRRKPLEGVLAAR